MAGASAVAGASAAAGAQALAEVVGAERLRLVAGLIRLTGDWGLAEDCVQDAVERALARWPVDGVPDNPGAWLATVARRRALDLLRRQSTGRARERERALTDLQSADHGGEEAALGSDDRLSLIFTSCHPALAMESRIALTLKVVGGLSTEQVARSFLVSESAMAQRLLRAKQRIAHTGIPFRVPSAEQLPERLDGVLRVVYLVYNAGYDAVGDELGLEAVRLGRVLVDLMPAEPEARGLLALMLAQFARRATRFDGDGVAVPMEEQDRRRWDQVRLEEAQVVLAAGVVRAGGTPGPYLIQAEIALCHGLAAAPELTPWSRIVGLYDALLAAQPSPVVELNRAVAVGFDRGFAVGLDALDRVEGLSAYHLLPAARADFLRRLGRDPEAAEAYREALALAAPDSPEARLLRRRLAEVSTG